jgi:hypothetical protein
MPLCYQAWRRKVKNKALGPDDAAPTWECVKGDLEMETRSGFIVPTFARKVKSGASTEIMAAIIASTVTPVFGFYAICSVKKKCTPPQIAVNY